MVDVVIIGAGLSGLALAYRLRSRAEVMLLEASNRVGGSISTRRQGGFLWEEGPNSFTPSPDLLSLIAEVGLAESLVWADRKLPRFVYWDGELLPVPMSPGAIVQSRLLTLGAKVRALRGLLGFVGYPPDREETVREFFSRHLGPQVVERLVAPFVSGVFAGDPDVLSATAAFARVATLEERYGGLLAGAFKAPRPPKQPSAIQPAPKRGELGNFKQGMQQLPEALAASLGDRLQLQYCLKSLEPTEAGLCLRGTTPEGNFEITTKTVVFTQPAYRAAPVLGGITASLQNNLEAIPYPHVATVALGYGSDSIPQPLAGFGQLFPRASGLRTLGTIWASSLFPGRAPVGQHTLVSYIGGSTDPEVAKLSDEELVQIVHGDLSLSLLQHTAQPQVLGLRRWQRAIPQYTLGHRDRLLAIQQQLPPGLFLCANYQDGVALGDCVRRANTTATQVEHYLKDLV